MVIKWRLSIGFPGAVRKGAFEIDDEEVEGLSDEARDDYISEVVHEHAIQHVDTSWEIEE